MSVLKAKAIVKTLRWHHVGFAFLWATTFAALLYPSTAPAGDILMFKTLNLSFAVVAVLALAVSVKLSGKERPRPGAALVAGGLLAVGTALFYAGFYLDGPSFVLIAASGVCVGVASGLFFAFWQVFFTSEGASRTALYIPLSAVASALLCFAMQALPFEGTVCFAVAVLPALAALSLRQALREIEPTEIEDRGHVGLPTAIRDLWKPVFCVCAIALVWKLVSHLLEDAASPTLLVVLAGFGAAAFIIALIELFSERGFEVLRSYQVLFPLITGAFLMPTLFGMQYAPVLSGTLMFGFEIVNLLLIITCAIYANERAIPSTYVYALCMVPTFVAMIAGDLLGARLNAAIAHDLSFVVGALFLCVYVLSLTMFLVSWTRQRKRAASEEPNVPAAPSTAVAEPVKPTDGDITAAALEEALAASFQTTLAGMELPDPLSQREREVALLIVRGNSVAGISRKLFISENTVRGHAKNIYRKLDVHSKQQLIDLFDV